MKNVYAFANKTSKNHSSFFAVRFKLLSLMCVLFIAVGLRAQVTTPSMPAAVPASPTSTYFYVMATAQNEWWGSQIITASELTAAGMPAGVPCKITELWHYLVTEPTAGSYTEKNQTIYMRNTTNSSYASAALPNTASFTQVFGSASIVIPQSAINSWFGVTLNGNFSWDGTSNIEILWESRAASFQNGNTNFAYSFGYYANAQAQYDYNTTNTFPTSCLHCTTTKNASFTELTYVSSCSPVSSLSAPTASPNPATYCTGTNSSTFTVATPTGTVPIAYSWQVSATGTGGWSTISDGGSNPAYSGSATTSLTVTNAPGTLYYQCIAANCTGSTSTSPSVALTINGVPASCPSGPSPVNSTTDLATNSTLSWSSLPDATGYNVYLGSPTGVLVSTNQSGTTYNPGALLNGTTYQWYIVPQNACGVNSSCSASNVWSFSTIPSGGGPNISTGTLTGSTFCAGGSINVPFTYTGSFNAGNSFTAQLSGPTGSYSAPVNTGSLSQSGSDPGGLSISMVIPSNTLVGTAYRIRVVASSPAATWSDNGTDLTVNIVPATCPSSPSPSNSLTGVPMNTTLSWSGVTGALGYDVYLGTPTPSLVSSNQPGTSYTTGTLLSGSTYQWYVVPRSPCGANSSCNSTVWSYTTGNPLYRTQASGSWNNTSTWQVSFDGGTTWSNATTYPTATNSDGIEILNGNQVTVTADVTVDQVTFDNNTGNSAITVNTGANLTVNDGAGNDIDFSTNTNARLTVNGTLTNGGQVNGSTATTTAINGTYVHAEDGGTIPLATWNTNSNCNITLIASNPPANLNQGFYNLLWNCPAQSANINILGANTPTNILGTFEVRACGPGIGIGSLSVGFDPGTKTWTGDILASGGQLRFLISTGTSNAVFTFRDLTINNVGYVYPSLSQTYGATINIRNLNILASGAFDFWGNYAVAGNIYLTGDLTLAGSGKIFSTNDNTGLATYNLYFNGTTQQNVNIAATTIISGRKTNYTKTIAFTSNSGSIVNFATPLMCGTGSGYVTFTAANGSTLMIPDANGIIATAGAIAGSVQVPGTGGVATFNTAANYTYNGTTAQVTGYGIPGTVNNLTLSNPAGVAVGLAAITVSGTMAVNNKASLSAAVTVNGTLAMNGALLTLGNNNLTVPSSSAITGTFSSANMIVTNGTGQLKILIAANGTLTFPIGDNSPAYSPFTFTYTGGTFSGTTYLGARVTNAEEPNVTSPGYLNRYWTLLDNITGGTGTGSFSYNAGSPDVVGTESNIYAVSYGVSFTGLQEAAYGLVNTGTHVATATAVALTNGVSYDFTGGGTLPGQAYFQSVASGNWNNTSTWNSGPSITGPWSAATVTPNAYNSVDAAGSILIQNGNQVTVSSSVTVAHVLIDNNSGNSSISVNSGAALTVLDGSGNDIDFSTNTNPRLTVNGTLVNYGQINGSTSTITTVNGTYVHGEDGGTIPLVTWGTNSNCNITGIVSAVPSNMNQNFYNLLWNNPAQGTNLNVLNANTPSNILGTFEVRSTGPSSGAFASEVGFDPGTKTWTGDVLVSGGQVRFIYSGGLNNAVLTFRDLTLSGTGYVYPNLTGSGTNKSMNLHIRNLNISGAGAFNFWGNYAVTTNVYLTGDFTLADIGEFYSQLANGATTTFSLFFNGTTQENVNISSSSLISGWATGSGFKEYVAFTANSGSIVNFATPFACGTGSYVNFTAANGSTLIIPDANGITSGSAQTTGSVRVPGSNTYGSGAATFNTGVNYTYDGSVAQITGSGLPATVNNLTFNNTSGSTTGVTLSAAETINGILTLTNGLVTLGANSITLPATASLAGTPSVSSMLVTNGTGKFTRGIGIISSSTSFLFPVGDATPNYTPVTLIFTSNSVAGTIGITTTNSTETNMNNPSGPYAYLTRYWTFSNTSLTNYSYTGSFTYPATNISNGSLESYLRLSQWTGSAWSEFFGSAASSGVITETTALNQASAPLTGDFTGRKQTGPPIWIGPANGDWSTATNWSPAGVPNSCSTSVIVNSGSPVISTQPISVGNITLGSGAVITLNGQDLSICGSWTGASTGNATVTGSGSVILNGSTAQTISGNTQFAILQINNANGVTLSRATTVSISTGLQLALGTLDASVATLHLLSTASNNNSYIDDFSFGANPGSITGNITADRYVPVSGTNQHYISSPLGSVGLSQIGASGPDGAYIIPTTTCDETISAGNSPYGSVFTYVDGHQPSGACMLGNWRVTTAGNMATAKGYSAYLSGNSTLSVTGSVNTGNMSIPNFNSAYAAVPTLQQTADGGNGAIESGWALVGNPYPSALDLTDLADRTAAGFDAQVQVWKTSGPFSGSWQATTITGESGVVVIPPFQAFMVHVTTDKTQGNYSYPFFQSERTRTANLPFYRSQNQNTLQLTVDFNDLQDMTTVSFNSSATNGFDAQFDANKQDGGAGNPTLYTFFPNATSWYSINTVPSLTQTAAIPMGLRPNNTGTMTIIPQGIESFDPTTYIYLEDKQTGVWTNLRNGAYSFTATPTENQQRFVLHFTPPAIVLTQDASCEQAGMINIQQPGSANWNYSVADNNNITVSSGVLNSSNPVSVSVIPGVYSIALNDNTGYTVMKTVEVQGSQPVVAAFNASETTAPVSDNILFTSTAIVSSYSWDFGDGTSASGPKASHSYQSEGVYIVKLTVTGASGCISTTSQTITVTSRSVTGITNLSDSKLNIWSYDNTVFVDFSRAGNVDAEVELYNVLGQMLSVERFGKSTLYSKELTNMDAAYIIVKVVNDDQVTTKKVFIVNANK